MAYTINDHMQNITGTPFWKSSCSCPVAVSSTAGHVHIIRVFSTAAGGVASITAGRRAGGRTMIML